MAIKHSILDKVLISTLVKGETYKKEDYVFSNDLHLSTKEPLLLLAADEIPFVFYSKSKKIIGALSLTKEDTMNEKLLSTLKKVMEGELISPNDLYCYLGPSLTFSHVRVDRETLLTMIKKGYRAATKRTDKVDYLDLPMLNVVILRNLGIPFNHIAIDIHDTYEAESLLYSESRGDKEKNPTLIEFMK